MSDWPQVLEKSLFQSTLNPILYGPGVNECHKGDLCAFKGLLQSRHKSNRQGRLDLFI
jgi:hypothetical protein